MTPILSITNLSKNYGGVKALQNVSFEVPTGSIFGILGPNGSGKTTLLGIVMDVLKATSGSFSWSTTTNNDLMRKQIGTLLETYKLLLDEGLDIGLLMHTGWTGDYSLDLYIDAIFGKDFDWNNKIFVTNQVPMTPTQMRWLYNICDLTILTSYNEGWGLSLTESLACDKPFVAPNIGGMRDQIKAVYDENYWIPALDVNPSIKVSTLFEPLYQSYVDPSDVFNSIMDVYNNTQDCYGYRKVAEKYFDSKFMSSTISKYIKETIENFVPHKKFTITKC